MDVLAELEALKQRLETRTVDLGSVLDEMRWATARALDADRATLYLVDHVRNELVSRSVDLPGINQIRLRIGEGLAGSVAATGDPQRLNTTDPRPSAAQRMDARTGYRTRTMLAVPLLDKRRVVGVLQVLNKKRGDFTDGDAARLSQIATQLQRVLSTTSLASQMSAETKQPLEFQFNRIIGDSPQMRELYDLVTRAAGTDITVLLAGESGTGKNLVARALHDNSPRRDGPFVVVDCGAFPEGLVENELFGHVAGAYTGAEKAAPGKVAAAAGGTLFLDEIGELSLQSQKKLLRLIQDRVYFPVGATKTETADVRFVCATNRDLDQAVADGTFRLDLLYRLRVVQLELVTLRARGREDLDRLIDHFLFEHARTYARPEVRLTRDARARLHAYDWPGNVRELRHVLEAAVVLSREDRIEARDLRLPSSVPVARPPPDHPDGFFLPEVAPLKDVVSAYATWALDRLEGNRSAAARALDISRNTLASHLKRNPE